MIRTRRERDRAGFEVAPDTVAPLRVDVGKHTGVEARGHHLVVGRALGEYGILLSLHCHLPFRRRKPLRPFPRWSPFDSPARTLGPGVLVNHLDGGGPRLMNPGEIVLARMWSTGRWRRERNGKRTFLPRIAAQMRALLPGTWGVRHNVKDASVTLRSWLTRYLAFRRGQSGMQRCNHLRAPSDGCGNALG